MMAVGPELGGVGFAIAAAAAFETSYVVQALEARRVAPVHAVRVGLIARLARRPAWLGGMALSVTGFGLQVVALRHVPLSVVQPVLALGLVFLLVLSARVLGEPVGRREVAAAALMIAGVVLLVALMPARGSADHPGGLAVACAALAGAAVAPLATRSTAPALLVCATVAGDSLAALAINEVARSLAVVAVAWAALAGAAGLLALTSETTALQRSPASAIAPIVVGGQVAIPVALAPLVAGDRWADTPLGGALVAAGVLLVVAGAALLGRSPAIGRIRQPA